MLFFVARPRMGWIMISFLVAIEWKPTEGERRGREFTIGWRRSFQPSSRPTESSETQIDLRKPTSGADKITSTKAGPCHHVIDTVLEETQAAEFNEPCNEPFQELVKEYPWENSFLTQFIAEFILQLINASTTGRIAHFAASRGYYSSIMSIIPFLGVPI